MPGLESQIVNWVNLIGASGVDIDFEDSNAFINHNNADYSGYNGVTFLSALTSGLYQHLPANGNIITHAPAPPYWDQNNSTYNAAYHELNSQVGNYIAWYNTQFYDNPPYSTDKVMWYEKLADEAKATGLLGKLLMGVSLDSSDQGYITSLDDMTQNVIMPLVAKYPAYAFPPSNPPVILGTKFGGVMTWEFAFDNGGAWANGIAAAL